VNATFQHRQFLGTSVVTAMHSLFIFLLLYMQAIFFPTVQAKPPQDKELIQSLQQAEALITALSVEYSEFFISMGLLRDNTIREKLLQR
jgi:hypothetical protein